MLHANATILRPSSEPSKNFVLPFDTDGSRSVQIIGPRDMDMSLAVRLVSDQPCFYKQNAFATNDGKSAYLPAGVIEPIEVRNVGGDGGGIIIYAIQSTTAGNLYITIYE